MPVDTRKNLQICKGLQNDNATFHLPLMQNNRIAGSTTSTSMKPHPIHFRSHLSTPRDRVGTVLPPSEVSPQLNYAPQGTNKRYTVPHGFTVLDLVGIAEHKAMC